jgi:hypothetical protein
MNTTIRDGDLEVCISGSFYGDRIASEHEVAEALKKADNANIMGERSVALAVSLGIVSRSSCTRIGSVPHALVFRL